MPVLTDTSVMPIGEHKGKKMANVPASYLLWLHNAGCYNADVAAYIKNNLDVIIKEAKG